MGEAGLAYFSDDVVLAAKLEMVVQPNHIFMINCLHYGNLATQQSIERGPVDPKIGHAYLLDCVVPAPVHRRKGPLP